MNRILTLTLCLLLCAAAPALALDEAEAKAKLGEEDATCAAYYDVIANCLEATRPLDKDLAGRYRQMSQRLAREAEELRGAPSEGAVLAAEETMIREIRQDCSALTPLKERYKELCKAVVEKKSARLQYWLSR